MTERPSPRQVIIIGAGGFGRETAALLEALQTEGRFEGVGFADDSSELQHRTIAGLPVLGAVEIVRNRAELGVVVTVGSPHRYDAKRSIVDRLALDPTRYVTLIHPTASVGTDVSIGEGTILLAGCVVTQAVTIGRHVAMMPNVVLTHDDEIGDFAILGAGVKLGGGVKIGEGAYIGSGVSVRESTVIGPEAMVGMGAVVLTDIPAGETWVGVPADRLS